MLRIEGPIVTIYESFCSCGRWGSLLEALNSPAARGATYIQVIPGRLVCVHITVMGIRRV